MNELQISSGLIFNNKNELLIAKRNHGKFQGFYEIPGGKVIEGESLKETCKRELKEELNLEVEVRDEIGQASYIQSELDRKVVKTCFLCKTDDSLTDLKSICHDEVLFVSLDDLLNYNLAKLDFELAYQVVEFFRSYH